MATSQVLRTYYSNLLRVDYAAIPGGDATLLNNLAASVDAGTISLAAAVATVSRLAINTTSVATLSYQFFTGVIPFERGIDYLVSPQGLNPNNLNAAYYQNFNIENRYINFAVNLGVAGEGQAHFAQGYGALTLRQAVGKAYGEIFGVAATEAKLDELLNFNVPNGAGGTYSRADYFAAYGRDGINGTGTKAAAIGWLLAQAAKENVGSYALANNALLTDLGPDGVARFHSDLLATYGAQPPAQVGATVNFAANQSVSIDASAQALRSTNLDDTITGAAGLEAPQSVKAGSGQDVVTITGAVSGSVDGQAGNDTITIDILNPSVPVLGGQANGLVSGGAGDDRIQIGEIKAGSTVDGGVGDDSLTLTNLPVGTVRGIEHLYFQGPDSGPGQVATGPGQTFMYPGMSADLTGMVDLQDVWNIRPGVAALALSNVPSGVVVGARGASGGLFVDYVAGAVDAHIHLDNTSDGLNDNWRLNANDVTLRFSTGTAHIHVDSDSAVRDIWTRDGTAIVIDGLGKLTVSGTLHIGTAVAGFAPFDVAPPISQRVDASAASQVSIASFAPGALDSSVILSSGDDLIGAYLFGQVRTNFTLGAGADTLRIVNANPPGSPGGVTVPAFANVKVTGSTIETYATVTDFQKGVDRVDLGSLIPTVTVGVMVGTASTLEQALINVSPQVSAGVTTVFEWGGDTWVYRQDGTVGVTSGDGLIRLVGVTGLTVGTGAGAADIHYG